MLFIIIAGLCSDPTNMLLLLNVEFKTGPTPTGYFSDGGVYEVKCKTGFHWLDGFQLKSIQCINGNWTNIPVACQGTNNRLNRLMF